MRLVGWATMSSPLPASSARGCCRAWRAHITTHR